jgi:hypothetical protein
MQHKSLYKGMTVTILCCFTALFAVAQTGKDSDPASLSNDLLTRFQEYQLNTFQEKIFVHTDKTFYVAGETIWFKIYEVDGTFHKLVNTPGISYIELIGKDQKPILQAKIDLEEGKGHGSFTLPTWILSGNYILRAYTSWMKNFNPEAYFMQPLTIINTLVGPVIFTPSTAPSPERPNATVSGALTPSPENPIPTNETDIQFFPEGGNLVYGLTSKVAVKVVGPDGLSRWCKGIIRNQNNDSIAAFETGRFGMGSFTLTPLNGNSYHAGIRAIAATSSATPARPSDKDIRTIPLPAPYDQGYVMNLSDGNDGKIRISVHTNKPAGNSTVYLFAQTHNRAKVFQANYLSNNEVDFYIDKRVLGDGVSHITIFNADKAPVCERLYFKPPEHKLLITAHIVQSDYAARKKIDVTLSTQILSPNKSGPSAIASSGIPASSNGSSGAPASSAITSSPIPAIADLSLSIFRIDSLQQIPEGNILNYLLLSSELKGKIESPGYYFDDTDPSVAAATDNLLLTQGWTRLRWEEILQNKQPGFEFLPETNGPVIIGKITDKRTGLPPSPTMGYLSIPGRNFGFSIARSRPDGTIRWNIKKGYDINELILQPDPSDSNLRIDLVSPFSDKFAEVQTLPLSLPQQWEGELLYHSINAQVENSYRINQKHRFSNSQPEDTLAFYGKPDKEYYLDDYTRFVTMEEVLKEYVADVRLRRQSGRSYFRVRNALFNIFFEDDPLLLLDGIPVFDADKILALDPLKIKKIDVVARKFYKGPLVNDGILSFKTYEGDLGGYSLDPNAIVIQYNGLQHQREFYSPVYDTREQELSPIPDLRNQLLWSPDIRTTGDGKKEISFYTSDLPGQFVLLVQGLTEDGLPGSTILHFQVTPPINANASR